MNLIYVNAAAGGPTRLGGAMLPSPGVGTVLAGICLICARKKYSGENRCLHVAVIVVVPITPALMLAPLGPVLSALQLEKPLLPRHLASSGLLLPRATMPGNLGALQPLPGILFLDLILSLLSAIHQLM